jgi:hypothetical protein
MSGVHHCRVQHDTLCIQDSLEELEVYHGRIAGIACSPQYWALPKRLLPATASLEHVCAGLCWFWRGLL